MSDNTEYTSQGDDDVHHSDRDKRPCLIMIRGDFIGQVYELNGDVTTLGRSDDIDVVVSHSSISRRHALILKRIDGFQITDLNSTNGTFVNKYRVEQPVRLTEGDKLTLGEVTFKFSYQDEDDTKYHMMLRNMAVKDGLTRIYNKRYFDEALEKEYEYNKRNKSGLSIVFFDIDHFKTVNDDYGHPAGDLVLKNLAALVENEVRGYDVFARYGGDEFVFLMRGTSLDAAVVLAERVRKAVDAHRFEYDGEVLNLTISSGVTHWNGDDDISSGKDLLKLVDAELYKAKGAGKNQTRF
ncbi:MAG: diguanylate cyclase (GGDEF)-like protein [Candidatus Azotimanducaceae bacterium]|jgi:diguanylate cyclase (GGDEF)-like protein